MSVLPDALVRAIEAGITQSAPSFILTSRVIIAAPRRSLEWDGLVMVTSTLHTRRAIEGNEPVWAIKYKGLYYVAEGNHRARAAHLWRQRRIAARLVRVPEGIQMTPAIFFAISMIIGSRQPTPRQLSWVDNILNVHRSIEEAKRHVRAAVARKDSAQDPEAMRLNRTSVGKVLFGPAFSKLAQNACVDPRRSHVDPLFNHSETGRVFWSGAVRLIQAGIVAKLAALVSKRFKLQTKHLRLATRLSKEQLQRALQQSLQDSNFNWENLISERDTQVSRSPSKVIRAESSIRTRNREARPTRPTEGVPRAVDKSVSQKPRRRIQTRSSSEKVHAQPKVPRRIQQSSDFNVAASAATDGNRGTVRPRDEETSPGAPTKAAKSRRLSKRIYPESSQGPPSAKCNDGDTATSKSPTGKAGNEPSPELSAAEKEDSVDAVDSNVIKTQSNAQEDPVREKTVSHQDAAEKVVVDSRASKALNKTVVRPSTSEDRGDLLEQSEGTQRPSHPESGCAVIGCEMGATSGMHKCLECAAPVHAYCCNRILGQPPQEDQTDPIYCSKCWMPNAAPQLLEKGTTQEKRGDDSKKEEKRMEEDRVAVNKVFKSLREVEGVRVLLGNHDQDVKRDFEEIMNLTRQSIRLTQKIRTRIGSG